jgi:parallel beta-helix repeat protein
MFSTFAMAVMLFIPLALQLNAFSTASSSNFQDSWAVIQDSKGDRLRVETSRDEVWAVLVQLYHNGSERWIGGIVERYNNEWGFRFDPNTILIAEITIEAWQTTIRGISQNLDYWLGHMAVVDAQVVAINPLRVPQDYVTIQEAINHAVNKGTILVSAGTYYEHIVVNKTVAVIGENESTTIIHGVESYPVVLVNAGNVTIKEFTVQYGSVAILIQSSNNSISGNSITNNANGIELISSSNNRICHNNFINNTKQAFVSPDSLNNIWDNSYPSGGNYWIDYTGLDANGDGIGDSPYVVDTKNQDNYPLMIPYPYISGDINRDGIININDLILLNQAYGSTPTSTNWNSNADLNNDKIIMVQDLHILARNYGKTTKA